jgi:hypothetical protein
MRGYANTATDSAMPKTTFCLQCPINARDAGDPFAYVKSLHGRRRAPRLAKCPNQCQNGGVWRNTMSPRSLVVVVGVTSMLCCARGPNGTETSLSALQGKQLDLTVLGSGDPTWSNTVDLTLDFLDVGKNEGDACPMIRTSATFGGAELSQNGQGGTGTCGLFDDPTCDKMCLNVSWKSDSVGPLVDLSDSLDVVLRDASETVVATMQNPALAATVTVLDLVEGQTVKYGDSFHIQIQAQPPATVDDIKAGLDVELVEARTDLPLSQDPPDGTDVWRVDIIASSIPIGPLTFAFWSRTPKLRFTACPSDFMCSGLSRVVLSEFALQLSP